MPGAATTGLVAGLGAATQGALMAYYDSKRPRTGNPPFRPPGPGELPPKYPGGPNPLNPPQAIPLSRSNLLGG